MALFKQLFWIILFTVLGDAIEVIVPDNIPVLGPIPGAIYGLVLLFICLRTGLLKLEKVDEVGGWLSGNMAIMFVPAGVGVMRYLDLLADNWWQIAIIIIVGTVLLIALIGLVTQAIANRSNGSDSQEV